MAPEIEPDDWLIAVRPRRLVRGDIVVVEHPERPGFELLKRLTGIPGDAIDAFTLGDDQYWVTGNDRSMSTDSRWFGPVRRRSISAVAVLRYWPPSRVGLVRSRTGGNRLGPA